MYGEDIMNVLTTSTVDEDLIEKVEKTISQIEYLRPKRCYQIIIIIFSQSKNEEHRKIII